VTVLKKYDLEGQEVGEINIEDQILSGEVNSQMIKDYLVGLRANARQWSAKTKGRSEVNHSGKKPHPQKGTGRARQGYLGAPQFKGGGRVFGPQPKFDQHVRINRKEKRSVINHLFTGKIQNGQLHVLQYQNMEVPKTKTIANFLKSRNLSGKRVLFLAKAPFEEDSMETLYGAFTKSMKNIPRLNFRLLQQVSGYDLALNSEVFVLDTAVDNFIDLMKVGASS
jgi:large subunit ribosomal protein L4